MGEQIVRCRCGRPYRFYGLYCGDQSKCPVCRAREREELEAAEGEYVGTHEQCGPHRLGNS